MRVPKFAKEHEHDQFMGIVANAAKRKAAVRQKSGDSRQWLCTRTHYRDADRQHVQVGRCKAA